MSQSTRADGEQAVSSRPDVAPPSYTAELEKLQDQIPPFSSAEAMDVLQAELGCPPSVHFSELSPEPVAAASLGQVRACCLLMLSAVTCLLPLWDPCVQPPSRIVQGIAKIDRQHPDYTRNAL